MSDERKHLRFGLPDRIEHWLLTISFSTLALTGLVQRYARAGISQTLIAAMGGIETVRIIHRIAAVILMLEVVYHLGVLGYRLFVRRSRFTMLPGLDDARNVLQAIQYNLGLRDDPPTQGRYTFEEKAEYWALVWGTLVMVATGFMLWNPIATTRFLPGEVIPAAKAAHSAEALLATLAILVWHFYGVHVKFFNKSMFTGKLTEEEMLDEHPLELARVKAGVSDQRVSEQVVARRKRGFFVSYAVLAAVMLVGVYWFVTLEESAVANVPPPEEIAVFAPLTPTPFPTPMPTSTPVPTATPGPTQEPGAPAVVVWADVAAILEQKCVACHNASSALGNVDLSQYQTALAVVEPGAPDDSLMVQLQEQGGHPGQLSEAELEVVRQWIEDGALETAAGAPPAPAGAPEQTTWLEMSGLFEEKCISCHNADTALGGVNLSTYASTLEVLNPGMPDDSLVVTLQEHGGHPGQFTAEELDMLRQWIAEGAPEGAPEGAAPEAATPLEWTDVEGLFQQKCAACHSAANAMAGVDLSDYEGALNVVQAGAPDDSLVVTLQEQGGHPGQFTAEELEQVRQWIAAGAQ
jgi:formate dehydrogenase gamma subunit